MKLEIQEKTVIFNGIKNGEKVDIKVLAKDNSLYLTVMSAETNEIGQLANVANFQSFELEEGETLTEISGLRKLKDRLNLGTIINDEIWHDNNFSKRVTIPNNIILKNPFYLAISQEITLPSFVEENLTYIYANYILPEHLEIFEQDKHVFLEL